MNRITRWLRHWFVSPRMVERAFPTAAMEQIAHAITGSEQQHSGEIRVAIEAALPWSYLRRHAPVRERAVMVFSKLRVWDTELNNGVLLYINLADHGIEIVADRGIARHVNKAQWEAVCHDMREHFRRAEFAAGVLLGIDRAGALLVQHFPAAEGQANPNELSNKPAVL